MNPTVGWALAALALWFGWRGWGWHGVVLGITVIAFWLILQFNRALRIMRNAAGAPLGHVPSAVMMNARLKRGMPMWQIVSMARSLGRPLDEAGERFAWADEGGAEVRLSLRRGRLHEWQLVRRETP